MFGTAGAAKVACIDPVVVGVAIDIGNVALIDDIENNGVGGNGVDLDENEKIGIVGIENGAGIAFVT